MFMNFCVVLRFAFIAFCLFWVWLLKTRLDDRLRLQEPGLRRGFSLLAQLLLVLVFLEAYVIDLLDTSALQIHKRRESGIQIIAVIRYQLAGQQSLRYAHHIIHDLISEPKWKPIILLDQRQLHLAEALVLRIFTESFQINVDIELLYLLEFLFHEPRNEGCIFVLTSLKLIRNFILIFKVIWKHYWIICFQEFLLVTIIAKLFWESHQWMDFLKQGLSRCHAGRSIRRLFAYYLLTWFPLIAGKVLPRFSSVAVWKL